MSRVVYLHVGAPKTGTTYLQDRLGRNVRSLAGHGVHVPTGSPLVSPALYQFRAALDLLGQDWGGEPGHATGAWDALMKKVRRKSGTVIVSHEILAPASPDKVARAMADLGDSEVHVVYSARDLARQLPAAWQESVKQGRRWSYERFLNRSERGNSWFYKAFDLPSVLSTWGAGLPPERIHLLTVPRPGAADGDSLWLRFCRATGLDPAWAPLDSDRANASLGIAETQVLRQLNRRMGRAPRREADFDELVRDLLARDEMFRRSSPPVRLPPDRYEWAEDEADRWIDWLEGSGVDVVGDVEDLRPQRPAEGERWRNPDKVGPRRQLRAALDALGAMTEEAAGRPDPDRQLVRRVRQQAQRLRRP
jgi:hypothetical protein